MAKDIKVLPNGSFERVESTQGLLKVQSEVNIDGEKYNIYTSGIFLRTPENIKRYDKKHITDMYGEFKEVYEEDTVYLKDHLNSSQMFLLVFPNEQTFIDVTYEEDILEASASTIVYEGTYYYDLHTDELKLLTELPHGYVKDDVMKREDAVCIYNPSLTKTCSRCGGNCISEHSCKCSEEAERLWRSDGRGLERYDYTPSFQVRGNQSGTITTIGVELEMVAPSREVHPNMSDAFKRDDFLYLMSDGSLPDLGVEMASHPFTYDWYKSQEDPFRLNYLRNLGMITKDESRAGMHFHIDKKSFKDDDHFDAWYRLLTSNLQYLEKLCGRTCGNYNEACNYPHNEKKKLDDNTNRTALISNRGHTIEFRMFKSDIDRVDFAIQFLAATVEYSKKVKTTTGWTRFKKFLKTKIDKYPDLKPIFIDKKVPKGLFRVFETDEEWLEDFNGEV